ncbi:MAG: molybdate/tungstate transport system permease protein [Bacteroidetes bacterium]|nr:MAG: molybdate/tungstate transport system permease protein [Bacteroidota bacterium]
MKRYLIIKNHLAYSGFMVAGALFLLFLAAPLGNLLLSTSIPRLFETLEDEQVNKSIVLSLSMAAVATLASALLIIPFAWLMVRQTSRWKHIISGLIDLPMMIPHSAAGIALLGVVNRESFVGKIASGFGLDFVDRPAGIAIAMAFVSVPYLYNAAYHAFSSVPRKMELAAANLGAKPSKVFFSISLPLSRKGILNGMVMMFARGMSEFGAVIILAYNPFTTPVLIFDRFNAFGLRNAQAISALFILISLTVFILLRILSKPEEDVRN